MKRQLFKNNDYFPIYFEEAKNQLIRRKELLKSGKVLAERLQWFNKGTLDVQLNLTIALYTAGYATESIYGSLVETIKLFESAWSDETVLLYQERKRLNQYTSSAYNQILWITSLMYLLDVDKMYFKILADIIDRQGVNDFLLDFIIRAKCPERPEIAHESYQDYFWIPEDFKKLREAISTPDKISAEQLVEVYVKKDWAKIQKSLGDNLKAHLNIHNVYFGYWSFEAAAIVKILGLDDKRFVDCIYYPKDLVHKV